MDVDVKVSAKQLCEKKLKHDAVIRVDGCGDVPGRVLTKIFISLRRHGVKTAWLSEYESDRVRVVYETPRRGRGEFILKTVPGCGSEIGAWKPPLMQKGEIMSEDTKVVNLKQKRDENVKLTCVECKHVVKSEDDWVVGLDLPASKQKKLPFGVQDSGRHICPECQEFQPHGVFDDCVKWNGGVHAEVPEFLIRDLVASMTDMPDGAHFNVGNAILNAVREKLIKALGPEVAAKVFPADRDEIRGQAEEELS